MRLRCAIGQAQQILIVWKTLQTLRSNSWGRSVTMEGSPSLDGKKFSIQVFLFSVRTSKNPHVQQFSFWHAYQQTSFIWEKKSWKTSPQKIAHPIISNKARVTPSITTFQCHHSWPISPPWKIFHPPSPHYLSSILVAIVAIIIPLIEVKN